MDTTPKPLKVFVSYSHKDEDLKSELDAHLSALKRSGKIQVWQDRQLLAGTEWDAEIVAELEAADIVLLLLSASFLASKYIWEVEIAKAIERQKAGLTRVIPIFLKPCDIADLPFKGFQGLPRDGKAVTTFANQDEALMQVAKGVRDLVEALGRKS